MDNKKIEALEKETMDLFGVSTIIAIQFFPQSTEFTKLVRWESICELILNTIKKSAECESLGYSNRIIKIYGKTIDDICDLFPKLEVQTHVLLIIKDDDGNVRFLNWNEKEGVYVSLRAGAK